MRTFEHLWSGVERALKESQYDSNAQSIRDDLRRGPSQASKKQQQQQSQESQALPAPKSKGKGKQREQEKDKGPKAGGPKDPKDPKGKFKGKGAPKTGTSTSKASAHQGSPPPCIFHARGKCTRTNCPFSHDTSAASATSTSGTPHAVPAPSAPSAPPKASSAAGKPKAASALVAFLGGLCPGVGHGHVMGLAGNPTTAPAPGFVEFIGDTGAGECLGSPEALAKQGFQIPAQYFVETSHPLQFSTGGGSQHGSTTVGCWSDDFRRLQNVSVLPQCPMALSIGQLCNDRFSFVWPSHSVPFLVPPTSHLSLDVDGTPLDVHRVEHHVPVFRISAELVPGLPSVPALPSPSCAPSGGGDTPVVSVDHSKAPEGPQEEGATDSELAEIALSPEHCLTHLPKSKNCPICIQAKLYEAPHRRRPNQREVLRAIRDAEEPTEPFERLACDHVISRTSPGKGGETCSFVIVDRFSGLVGLQPCTSKGSEEVETALRKFCGRKRPGIVSVSSDRAPEILSALSRLGFNAEPAEPNQPLHNPIAESFVRTLKGMTSSLLLQAGFPHEHWPLAHKFIEWIHPVTAIANNEESKTCFEKHHGYVFEGFKLPFGSLVWVKNHDALPFDPKGEPALFLGAELIDGQRFKGLYRVF